MTITTTSENLESAAIESTSAATTVETNEVATDNSESNVKPSANSEAARYRTQLRAAETSLAKATSRIAAYQQADVLRAATGLAQPEDLLDIGGHSLDAFLAEDGSVDAEAVATAVAALLELRPGLATGARVPVGPKYPAWGQGAPTEVPSGRSTSWAKALNPHRS